ncbi:Histone deacetylase-like amidohydrolase [Methylobacterium crusticola]|uniref:Histone deacetylase-like amidohydrolase n=1 Tax=Methylobacterium crusticola TaxID=1697972 RepID=A0ABQ4QX89_9HYPH|nr:histone deacetylase family protein [Methylobacterium crusticola]GJD49829.1 Histone deacetylase-like amidohydrolase [Methylobacterium crusticola]
MTTLYLCHPASLDHAMPPGHPERADRIRVIERVLEDERFGTLVREQAPRADLATAALAHPEAYVAAIAEAAPREGMVAIDADTVMSPGTLEAALRAVGAAVQAVDEVMTGRVGNAFAAMRPPGHHAERARAMGFCLFNNAAVAVRHARARYGAQRVALVDWDVHHGNGSQDIFWGDRDVMYCSTHQMPLFPGTGAASERGDHDTIVNVPLHPGDDGTTFREAFAHGIAPRLDAFRPDLIVISAGFDAHWRDPLANLKLTEADFAWATREVMAVADRHAGGRVVSLLEGGYDLEGLSRSVAAHVETLMGR